MRGSQIYTTWGCAPGTLPSGKNSYPKSELDPIYMCVKFQLSTSDSYRDIKKIPNFAMGRQISTQTSPSFSGQSSRAFWRWQGRVPHSVWRRRLSMRSFVAKLFVRHLMSNSVSEMPIFGGFGWFFCGERPTNFRGCSIKLLPDRILCESMSGIRSVTSEITFRKKNKVQR